MIDYREKIGFGQLVDALEKISKETQALKIPLGFRQFILYFLAETFTNIQEHSQARTIEIGLKINEQNCLIMIADDGIGFRNSYLKKSIYPKDDSSAIEFALSGLSTKDPRERGFGLYSIRKLVEKIDGRMIIETGRASAVISNNRIEFSTTPEEIAGVKITLEAPARELDFYEVIK